MRETKRRLETFSLYDRTGLEAHLARMAERGWLLDKIGPFFWTYRKIEPKRLTFSVTYFPKASQFDPGPSEEQQTFYDLCAHSGWVLAAASAQLQVFYSEEPDPVPIDTDPALEVETIHRTMKKSLIPSQLALLALAVFQIVMFVWRAADDPIVVLSSPASLFAALCWVLVLLLVGVELGSYFRWRGKAVLAAEHGEFLATRSHRKLQIGALVFLGLGVAWFILSIALSGNRMIFALTIILFLVYIPGLLLVVWGVSGWLKRRETPAKLNMVVTFIALAVAAYAFLGVLTFGMIFGDSHGWFGGNQETYEYNGRTFTLDRDPLPLGLDDLLEGDFSRYTRRWQGGQSLLLGRYQANQWPIGPIELFPEPIQLNYEVILVKAPFLYDLCRENMLHRRDDWDSRYFYAPADPAPWGAEEAYCWTDGNHVLGNQYLLFYPDRIVAISLEWDEPPTPEQMAAVGEKLGRGELP